jgi:hypothetical protein
MLFFVRGAIMSIYLTVYVPSFPVIRVPARLGEPDIQKAPIDPMNLDFCFTPLMKPSLSHIKGTTVIIKANI